MSNAIFKVLQKNERFFIKNNGSTFTIGEDRLVPIASDSDVEIMGEFWADAVQDAGIWRGYSYVPVAKTATAPSSNAFKVTRLKDKKTGDNYVVMVTLANYLADTATAVVPPVVVATLPLACPDASSQYIYLFELPYGVTPTYAASVDIAGVRQDTPVAQTSLANLVIWLNTNIPEAGTWSASGGRLKLVNTTGATIGVTIVGA
jgi:hypothetical protein